MTKPWHDDQLISGCFHGNITIPTIREGVVTTTDLVKIRGSPFSGFLGRFNGSGGALLTHESCKPNKSSMWFYYFVDIHPKSIHTHQCLHDPVRNPVANHPLYLDPRCDWRFHHDAPSHQVGMACEAARDPMLGT